MRPDRPRLLTALVKELDRSLSRFSRDGEGIVFPIQEPHRLKQQVDEVAKLFDMGAPPAPPLQQRLQALARLRAGHAGLSRRDWILITWGLCDDCGPYGKAIEDESMFEAVMLYTDRWIEHRDVPRRGWFGLLNSYLSYDGEHSAGSGNWLRLRGRLVRTMPVLLGSLKRPRLWSRMLEQHQDILTDDAGRSLRDIIFYGAADENERIEDSLQIPESSWIWRRVVAHQINHLNSLKDADFLQAIATVVAFLRTKPLYSDELLAALLTRYYQSSQRAEAHELLKSESFSRWGNPQLRGATRWSKVEAPVRSMVLRWFAKEDLEHFFSLLQGNGQVDQARLKYWLRFVDQISYTRILLGADAMGSQHPEFRNFRDKNKARCGHLVGGPSHNNAFIMRINDHYFVEFSGTGNACYAYEERQLGFDPNAKVLHSTHDLKDPLRLGDRQRADNRIVHSSNWQWKADQFLARRGINPGHSGSAGEATVKPYQPQFSPHTKQPLPVSAKSPKAPERPKSAGQETAAKAAVFPTRTFASASVTGAMKAGSELARINGVKVQNNLDKGGAFWVLTNEPGSPLGRELTRLGMNFNPGKGFWIK